MYNVWYQYRRPVANPIECELPKLEPEPVPRRTNHTEVRNRQHRHCDHIERLTVLLEQTRIIPAVRSREFLLHGTECPGKIVYFLFGNPEDIGEMAEEVIAAGKVPIVNVDLAAGLTRDHAAISYLAHRHVQGIISTHPEPLRAAREFGLFAIKRTFLLDSAALDSALRSLDQFEPDALEVLPAMAAPCIVDKLHRLYPSLPVIAGGLIKTLREIEALVQQGINSVSVSDSSLWVA
jgi:glycerol uptake operon antiterminator